MTNQGLKDQLKLTHKALIANGIIPTETDLLINPNGDGKIFRDEAMKYQFLELRDFFEQPLRTNEATLAEQYNRLFYGDIETQDLYTENGTIQLSKNNPISKLAFTRTVQSHPLVRDGKPFRRDNVYFEYSKYDSLGKKAIESINVEVYFGLDFAFLEGSSLGIKEKESGVDAFLNAISHPETLHPHSLTRNHEEGINNLVNLIKKLR